MSDELPTNPACPWPDRYSIADQLSSEDGVGRYLAGLVHILKPNWVIETGTYHAGASYRIAEALWECRCGQLLTFETDHVAAKVARVRLQRFAAITMVVPGTLQQHGQLSMVDLAFIDSNPVDRQQDIETLLPVMRPGGVIAVHDTASHPFLRDMLDGLGLLSSPYKTQDFWTPRGLTVIQVPYNAA